MATKKSTSRTAAKKAAAATSTAKKGSAKKATSKKAAPKKGKPAQTATVKKASATTSTAKKPSAKKTTSKKASSKPTIARQTPLIGTKAPDFRVVGDDGRTHALSDHAGATVVVYFYPRDDTPGCTVEACEFRDAMARVAAAGAVVYGVSRDTVASHLRFKSKYGLNFTLLSDSDLAMHRAYGAWGTKNMYGKVVEGTIRSTYVIDGQGRIARAWPTVKVAGHVAEVLAALAT